MLQEPQSSPKRWWWPYVPIWSKALQVERNSDVKLISPPRQSGELHLSGQLTWIGILPDIFSRPKSAAALSVRRAHFDAIISPKMKCELDL